MYFTTAHKCQSTDDETAVLLVLNYHKAGHNTKARSINVITQSRQVIWLPHNRISYCVSLTTIWIPGKANNDEFITVCSFNVNIIQTEQNVSEN